MLLNSYIIFIYVLFHLILRFIEDYKIACLEFTMNRLFLYTMAHTYKDYYFLSRVIESHFAYMLPQMESEMELRSRL